MPCSLQVNTAIPIQCRRICLHLTRESGTRKDEIDHRENRTVLLENVRILGNLCRQLSQDPLRNGHRPSADYLFESVAKVYQNHALGVIMTGMGRDGAAQLAEMRKQGAWTIGQDEASSIVYGMPKVAWELGAVQEQVPLERMAEKINELVRAHLK